MSLKYEEALFHAKQLEREWPSLYGIITAGKSLGRPLSPSQADPPVYPPIQVKKQISILTL